MTPVSNAAPITGTEAPPPESLDTDWRRQLARRLTTRDDFQRVFRLSAEEVQAFEANNGRLVIGVTPYFASLASRDDPSCPIRRQIMPTIAERDAADDQLADPLGEEAHAPVLGLIHRYPDRALLMITRQCASYCRYCTRARLVGRPERASPGVDRYTGLDRRLAHLREHPEIRDVILSGGDPLVLSSRRLDAILTELRSMPSVEVIRLNTRTPVFLPMRITDDLLEVLHRHAPIWIGIHANHPAEIAEPTVRAISALAGTGNPLLSQSVLLSGINDRVEVLEKLFRTLMRLGVRPYHLYHCDPVSGTAHFRTDLERGAILLNELRARTSGLGLPSYVLDRAEGEGKVDVILAGDALPYSPHIIRR